MPQPARHLTHGVHIPPDAPLMEVLAALQPLLPASGVFTGLTAAMVHDLWLPSLPAPPPIFVAMGGRCGEVKPIRHPLVVSRHPTAPAVALIDGIRVATAPEMLLACGRYLGLLDLVVLVDSVLARGLATPGELHLAAARRRRGAPLLRQALLLADGRSESPWESVLRVFHVTVGVQVIPQQELYDARGRFVARADLLLAGTRVLHEYDGAVHREATVHRADLSRDRDLLAAAYVRRGYTSADLRNWPHQILRDCDVSLGRPHDLRRLDPWFALTRESVRFGGMPIRLRRVLEPRPPRKLVSYGADSGD